MLQAFDDLLLLKSGGVVTYHGSLGKRSSKLIEYFQVRYLSHKLLKATPQTSQVT